MHIFSLVLLILQFSTTLFQPETLNGTWKGVSSEAGGWEVTGMPFYMELIIIDKDYTIIMPHHSESGILKVEEDRMIFSVTEGPEKGKEMRAIYKLKSDKLQVTFTKGPGFPKKMSTAADPATYKITFKRVK
jgi:uncharacterized protein (TIGR03067 family)